MNKLLIIGMVALLVGCDYGKKAENTNSNIDKFVFIVDGKPL